MEYIELPLCGIRGDGKFTIVDGDYDGEYFSGFRWYFLNNGYVGRKHETKNSYIYLHREVMNPPKGLWVDHINRNKLDNRSCNLRLVTPQENALNRPQSVIKRSTISGYRGVLNRKDRPGKKIWVCMFRGKHSGYFYSAKDAAYDVLAKEAYGNDAILNFP